jgi:hypothetical protein
MHQTTEALNIPSCILHFFPTFVLVQIGMIIRYKSNNLLLSLQWFVFTLKTWSELHWTCVNLFICFIFHVVCLYFMLCSSFLYVLSYCTWQFYTYRILEEGRRGNCKFSFSTWIESDSSSGSSSFIHLLLLLLVMFSWKRTNLKRDSP